MPRGANDRRCPHKSAQHGHFFAIITIMNRLRKIIALFAMIVLLPWHAALALPNIPEVPNCDFNGDVRAIEVMPDGTTYVGGLFTTVTCDGGVTNYTPSRIAKIQPDGQFDPTWDNKGVNGPVLALETDGTRLYVGGDFTEAIGNPTNYGYNNIAALELATGYADTSFMEEDIGAGTNGPVYTIINNTHDGSGIIIGGDFTAVSDSFVSLAHSGIGFLANDGLVAQSYGLLSFVDGNAEVNALALDGSILYVGGSFRTVNWDVGSVIRQRIAAVDLSLDAQADPNFVVATFDPDLNQEVRAIAVDTANARVFIGGDFTQAKVNTTPTNVYYLHPFYTATGEPDLIYGVWPDVSVTDLDLDNGELFVSGNFGNVFGSPRNFVASLDVSDIAVTLTSWDPNPDSDVHVVEVTGNYGAMGGNFNSTDGATTLNFARFETTPPPSMSISGTVFEDVNFGLNAGRSRVTAYGDGGLPVVDATVEIYDGDTLNYITSVTTSVTGEYTWTAPGAGEYIVRVVDASVVSGRTYNAPAPSLVPVTTFVTSGGLQVTNRVGGAVPNFADAQVNNGSQTFADLINGGETPQTFGLVDVTGDMTAIDFGYNFNLVVNVNDAGRGSLRSAIENSNALSNAGLAQNGYAGGTENIVFRIPNGTNALGMDGALDLFNPVQSAAVITLSSGLPLIDDSLRLDGTTQPSLPANTSTPIVIEAATASYGLRFTGPENQVRGFSIVDATFASLSFADGINEITGNWLGIYPDNTLSIQPSYAMFFEDDDAGEANTIGSSGEPNFIPAVISTGVMFMGTANDSVIQGNYFGIMPDGQTIGYCYDGIQFSVGGTDVIVGGATDGEGNVFGQCFGTGIRHLPFNSPMERLLVQGNYFGTDAEGLISVDISTPIFISNAIDVTIGGVNPGEGNLFVATQNPVTFDYSTGTRIYGNTFGLYSDEVTPAPISGARALMFTNGSTDTEIGDGTTAGANVFAPGVSSIDFISYGEMLHKDVRFIGNFIGVDRTGTIPFPISSNFQFNAIDGLQIGGTNPGEGNHSLSDGGTLYGVAYSENVSFLGNKCNTNADASAPIIGTNSDCLSLYQVIDAQVGSPGNGRNHFGAFNTNVNISQSEQVIVQNNYFNINATGSAPLQQNVLRGLSISASTNTLVGGINPGEGNLFGPHKGSLLAGDLGMAIDIQENNGVWIQGNIIGSDITGTKPFESDFGIGISGIFDPTQNVIVGGNTPAHGNIIFGGFGILLYGNAATGIIVQNNSIGVNSLGVATSSGAVITQLPFSILKPAGIGIIWGANNSIIQDNIIGGTPTYISGTGPGVYIAQDTNSPFGPAAPPSLNRISRNSFRNNAGPSIDIEDSPVGIGGDGVTPNDGIVDPTRAHYGLDYPIITSSTLVGGNLYVEGFVGSANGLSAFADVEVEIYEQVNDGNQNGEVVAGDGLSLPHGEGYLYLGTIMTSSSGGDFIGVVSAPFLASASSITAIAIDSLGNTSEFGVYFDGIVPPVIPPAPTPTPVVTGGAGALTCNLLNPLQFGNSCDNIQNLPAFVASPNTLPPTPQVPLVPMPWLEGEVVIKTPEVCRPLINKYMRRGATNDAAQVRLLQAFLKDKERLYTGAINGVFDRATDTAVRAFQKKYAQDILAPWGHSTPTGYVYLTTSRKINALNCQP